MKIIVVGCGKIGTTIIDNLVKEGHDVVAIDPDSSAINEVTNIYDAMCVCGNGADSDALAEAGVDKAKLVVAVTGSDEVNMLACFIAKKMGAAYTIARIRNPEYNDQSLTFLKNNLDLSLTINPERLAAQELFNILKLPSAVNIETFSRGNFEMVELLLKNNSALDGLSLIELRKKFAGKYLICTVQRDNEVYIPDGNFVLSSGDRIGLTAEPIEIEKLLKKLGIMQRQARNVMILGGSRTAYYLAKLLLAGGNSVKIIDKDRERCTAISSNLPGAVVIAGDGAEQELLLEEGIRSMDAFVALTGMDEENILISFFASAQNVPKVISKVNRAELANMAEKLGLDCIVSPKRIVSDVISSYARALENSLGSKVETLYKLVDGKAEALEFIVQPDFRYVNIPLKEMRLQSNILIAGIIRGRKAVIPAGDDMIYPGDRVIIVAAGHQLNDLSDIMK